MSVLHCTRWSLVGTKAGHRCISVTACSHCMQSRSHIHVNCGRKRQCQVISFDRLISNINPYRVARDKRNMSDCIVKPRVNCSVKNKTQTLNDELCEM
jgi:hypothetical protein